MENYPHEKNLPSNGTNNIVKAFSYFLSKLF